MESSSWESPPDQVNGRDFFDQIYRRELLVEAEWLRLTSLQKTHSISTLLRKRRITPVTLGEIGCGTGAVIRECKKQRLAEKFTAIDYSTTALEYLSAADSTIEIHCADITSQDFKLNSALDVVFCSHVIEHLEEPGKFLAALRERVESKHFILEVPLEALPVHNFKLRGKDRLINFAGHVQFFTSKSFDRLLSSHGFRIIARRRYVPILNIATIRFVAARHKLSLKGTVRKFLTNNLLPTLTAPVWSRIYYAHYTVLCVKEGSKLKVNR